MIKQRNPELWETKYGRLIIRIGHLHLLIKQVKEECNQIYEQLPESLTNQIQELNMRMELVYQQLKYTVNIWDDMQKQRESEPLIIKRERKR